METKVTTLQDAVRVHVRERMHLHFASTPSRANRALLEVARAFYRRRPCFVLSTSGFHSSAHLLALLELGTKFIACFFGDNYPAPRPNPLYQKLYATAGVELQVWSLLSYVQALRAGAEGKSHAVTNSLRDSDLANALAKAGAYSVEKLNDGTEVSLVAAITPDITFVHGVLGDRNGNILFSEPKCEGYWSCYGARHGVVATVEKVVEPEELSAFRDAIPISAHKVLAVCEAPRGAHPQPFFVEPRFGVEGYADDFDHYRVWRQLTLDPELFANFRELVLESDDLTKGYDTFCENARPKPHTSSRRRRQEELPKSAEVLVALGARTICEHVKRRGLQTIIAGIGMSYFASRLAKLWLTEEDIDVSVIVETGILGIPCDENGHEFLLSYHNARASQGICGAVEALGLRATGANNRCLGVLGAAQIDEDGNLNSTLIDTKERPKFLVGSGGANDIAAGCEDVIVLSRCDRKRFVKRVDHRTSPGTQISEVVSDLGTFVRLQGGGWELSSVYPALGGRPVQESLDHIRESCCWNFSSAGVREYATPLSTRELKWLHTLDPHGDLLARER